MICGLAQTTLFSSMSLFSEENEESVSYTNPGVSLSTTFETVEEDTVEEEIPEAVEPVDMIC
jgi:hypothetical protein